MFLGWSLDPDGNIRARWMVTTYYRYRIRLIDLPAAYYIVANENLENISPGLADG